MSDTEQLVVLRIADEHYAVPISQVQEIIRYEPPRTVASELPGVEGVISLRGKVVTVFDLSVALGLPRGQRESAEIMIVDVLGVTAGLVVDGVDEVITAPVEDRRPAPRLGARGIDGVLELERGLVLTLDLELVLPGGLDETASAASDAELRVAA